MKKRKKILMRTGLRNVGLKAGSAELLTRRCS
jgi:hypothetical protein